MGIFIVKINNKDIVESVENGEEFVHAEIYNFETEIEENDLVFIYFGGDRSRISWAQGLRAIGEITKPPYDKGYSLEKPRYFKIRIKPLNVLKKAISPKEGKIHPKYAEDLYNVPYVGANHFPNQAISQVGAEKEINGIVSLYLEKAPEAKNIFSNLGIKQTLVQPLKMSNLDEITNSFLTACSDCNLKITPHLTSNFISAILTKPFVILTGLSGSGKTKIAQSFAKWLTPSHSISDPFKPETAVPSGRINYYVKNSDSISVEFWNDKEDAKATRVSLPREMITEWADYIKNNNIPRETQAREIREKVKVGSRFSDQLHSFETHLKAAAFRLIAFQGEEACKLKGFEIIAVGADWDNNENLFGYPDALRAEDKGYCKPSNGALDLIIRASRPENSNIPFFLILDEMNLSHVERYFADMLSAIESGEPVDLHAGDETDLWGTDKDVPGELKLPPNLFIIGTVNIDETTYMFSPKVLDRANVIEFRVTSEEMEDFLGGPSDVDLDLIEGKGKTFAEAFAKTARISNVDTTLLARNKNTDIMRMLEKSDDISSDEELLADELKKDLIPLFNSLEEAGAEFGYRSAHEIQRFFYFYTLISGDDAKYKDALDAQVMQKLLPKLNGSIRKLGSVLEKLEEFCKEEQDLPASLQKIKRMKRNLESNGFTSFAEA